MLSCWHFFSFFNLLGQAKWDSRSPELTAAVAAAILATTTAKCSRHCQITRPFHETLQFQLPPFFEFESCSLGTGSESSCQQCLMRLTEKNKCLKMTQLLRCVSGCCLTSNHIIIHLYLNIHILRSL